MYFSDSNDIKFVLVWLLFSTISSIKFVILIPSIKFVILISSIFGLLGVNYVVHETLFKHSNSGYLKMYLIFHLISN